VMKRILRTLLVVVTSLIPARLLAQFTLVKGENTFEIGGDLLTLYNYKFYQPDEDTRHKNAFDLDRARIDIKGRQGNWMRYHFQFDFAALLSTPGSTDVPDALNDAYVEFNAKYLYIRTGYTKVPYSFSSLVGETDDAFMQRATVIGGDVFARRDLGVTLIKNLPQFGLNFYGGVYTGMGTQSLIGQDDPSGKLEYIGRVEYSYPAKYNEDIIDWRISPVPIFEAGVNARYAEKDLTSGANYSLLTIDGQKTSYGFDASVMYKGFSFQLESHQLHIVPRDSTRLISEGNTYSYFRAGGYLAQINYYLKPIKSVFAVRYDEFNPTDLTWGDTERTVAFAYDYMFKQNFACIKLQYEHHLPLESANIIWKDDEIRLGLQFIFN